MMRLRIIGVAVALAAPTSALTATQAPADSIPELAGTTVIEGTGVVGITVRLTKETRPTEAIPQVEYDGVTFAFIGMGPTACDRNVSATCMYLGVYVVPSFLPYPFGGYNWDSPRLKPGLYDFFFVTDGWVRITATFPELSGRTELVATGEIMAEAARMPERCPTQDCRRFRAGGVERTVEPGTFVSAIAFSSSPDWPPYDANSFQVCMYPYWGPEEASTDPDDYPLGCDFAGTDDLQHTAYLWTSFVGGTHPGGSLSILPAYASGPVYGGYATSRAGLSEEWPMGAWLLWVRDGVSCPSGDWTNCLAT